MQNDDVSAPSKLNSFPFPEKNKPKTKDHSNHYNAKNSSIKKTSKNGKYKRSFDEDKKDNRAGPNADCPPGKTLVNSIRDDWICA